MVASEEPTRALEPVQLWTADGLRDDPRWQLSLPTEAREELRAFAEREPAASSESFRWRAEQWPALCRFGDDLRRELEEGAGVVLLRGLVALGLGVEHVRCAYVAIGCALGTPMMQYGRLYPVVDSGGSHEQQTIPVSMTNAETRFHTDSSSVDAVPDYVGLLCEEPSLHGGDSLVSNAARAHLQLGERAPELLALLEQPLIRDVVTPGRERNQSNLLRNRFPVFQPCARSGGVLFRYMRYWIEKGQERAGAPLDAQQRAALDLLDQLLEAPDNVVRFAMARGDLFWINNRRLAHNRTAYRDTPGNVRQLQRMWIQA